MPELKVHEIEITSREYRKVPGCGQTGIANAVKKKIGQEVLVVHYTWDWQREVATVKYTLRRSSHRGGKMPQAIRDKIKNL